MEKVDQAHPLRKKYFISLVMISLFIVVIFTFIALYLGLNMVDLQNKTSYFDDLSLRAEEISLYLANVEEDVLFLSELSVVKGYIEALKNENSERTGHEKEEVTGLFSALGRMSVKYMQLRVLDTRGRELLRVDFDEQHNSRVIEDDELQDKSDRYYFSEAMKLKKGDIFVSPVDLNREGGEIEVPYRPTIRYSTVICDDRQEVLGVIVANIYADGFLHAAPLQYLSAKEKTMFLIDDRGFYLYHRDEPQKEWGGPEDLNTSINFKNDYAESGRVLAGTSGSIYDKEKKEYLFFKKIFPFHTGYKYKGTEYYWVLVTAADRDVVLSPFYRMSAVIGAGVFAVIILVFLFSWRISSGLARLEHELVRQRMRADEANRIKGKFLASMSHELRTPLNAIIGFSRLMLDDGTTGFSDTQRGYIRNIQESGLYLLSLINDLLDFSKIEAGKMDVSVAPLSLDQVLSAAVSTMRDTASKKSVTINYPDNLPETYVLADGRRLQQVLYNIISNAIKFTPEQGNVDITFRTEEKEAVVSIKDSGIGIEKSDYRHIFEEFKQIDPGKAGTGLGMVITKKLIELHKGRIWFESGGKGKGTCFYFTLPLTEKPPAPLPADAPVAGGDEDREVSPPREFNRMTILLAEDNLINQKLAFAMLDKRGYHVVTAGDGQAALDLYARQEFDLILMDVQMPLMNGYEVTRAIREKEKRSGAHIPIIAMTAHAFEQDRQAAADAGMDGYVSKPIDVDLLYRVMDRNLNVDEGGV